MNLTPDPGNEYMSDGLTEEVIDRLTQVKGLRVVARTSVFQFKNRSSDIRKLGEQLNVQAVLEGSVRRDGNRLRVTAQFNKAADGYHLWSHTYEHEWSDVFTIEEEIAQSIVNTLRENLGPGVYLASAKSSTASAEAQDLYLKGLYQQGKMTRGELEKASVVFKQAIAIDPQFAAARAALARCYSALGHSYQVAPKETYPLATAMVQKALAIDDSLAEAHTVLGSIHMMYDWDWEGAKRELERAIALDPELPLARHWHSHYLVMMGRWNDSLAESKKAIELDPLDLPISAHMGWHYLMARQYDSAVAALLRSIELEPNQFWPWGYLRRAYEQEGDFEHAIGVIRNIQGAARACTGAAPRRCGRRIGGILARASGRRARPSA